MFLPDYCGKCGKPLKKQKNGSCIQCCGGIGYWSANIPEKGIKLPKIGGMYFLYMDFLAERCSYTYRKPQWTIL